jgi:phage shock protein PspC (stress-responsive transcriptional regulator)
MHALRTGSIDAMTEDFTNAGSTPAPPPAETTGGALAHLHRSRDDRMVGGVCGGLGRSLGIDPVVFRITLAVLAVFGGVGLLLYGAGWLLIPEDGTDESEGARLLRGRTSATTVAAIAIAIVGLIVVGDLAGARLSGGLPVVLVLAVVAVFVAARRPGPGHPLRSRNPAVLIPVAIVAAVVGLIIVLAVATSLLRWSRSDHVFGYSPAGRDIGTLFFLFVVVAAIAAVAVALRSVPAGSSRWRPSAGVPKTEPASQFGYPTTPLGPPAGFSPSRPVYPEWTPSPAPKPPREPSFLVPLTVSLGVAVVGVLLALGASGGLDITAPDVFAAALLTTGLGLVVATWLGRGPALIPIGILLTIGLVIAATVDVPLRGGIGSREITVGGSQQLQSTYRLGIGKEDIDARDLLLGGHTAHLSAQVGVGRLVVSVPENVRVVVQVHDGAGHTDVFDVAQNGTSIDHTTVAAAEQSPQSVQAGELDLDLRIGVGAIDVFREPADAPVVTPASPQIGTQP